MMEIRIRPAGDAALVLELPRAMDEETSSRVVAIARGIRDQTNVRLRDVVVGYHTVTVYFDPLLSDRASLERELVRAAEQAPTGTIPGRAIEVPVCYGGDLGPDLAEVARWIGATEAEVVRLHTAREYRVFVVGFVPGFAYMGPLDPRLATLGRRRSPRPRVPAGSVAIAAGQTGVYPTESPGGWHLLGRTPIRPFDPARTEAALFAPGDHVRFRAIERVEFDRTAE